MATRVPMRDEQRYQGKDSPNEMKVMKAFSSPLLSKAFADRSKGPEFQHNRNSSIQMFLNQDLIVESIRRPRTNSMESSLSSSSLESASVSSLSNDVANLCSVNDAPIQYQNDQPYEDATDSIPQNGVFSVSSTSDHVVENADESNTVYQCQHMIGEDQESALKEAEVEVEPESEPEPESKANNQSDSKIQQEEERIPIPPNMDIIKVYQEKIESLENETKLLRDFIAQLEKKAEESKKKEVDDELWTHFHLLVQSFKVRKSNESLASWAEALNNINSRELYKKALSHAVPFYNFSAFIEEECQALFHRTNVQTPMKPTKHIKIQDTPSTSEKIQFDVERDQNAIIDAELLLSTGTISQEEYDQIVSISAISSAKKR